MSYFDNLLKKIRNKKAQIGVIGQGYVGLPLAIAYAKNGFKVTGLDLDSAKVKAINKGISYLGGMGIEEDLKKVVKAGFLKATTKIVAGCKNQDIIIICVPTPIDLKHKPDIRLLKKAVNSIALAGPLGKLIINESTVAPLMTELIVGRVLFRKTGLWPGKDFFLGCSPERINPGDATHRVENTPKIVAGLGKKDLILMNTLYRKVIKAKLIKVGSIATAEAVKILENSYRAVNIALINELAKFCQKTNLDVLEIIEAAKSKWTFQAHYPGIGVGGHCIPVDPYYLLEQASKNGVQMPVLKNALRGNERMPAYVYSLFRKYYKKGLKILVYGLSYKKDLGDLRESPALEFCRILKNKKVNFLVYDPFFDKLKIEKLGFQPATEKYKSGVFNHYEILVIATGHSQLNKDIKEIVGQNAIIIDGRNFVKRKIGKIVIGIGRKLS